MCLSFWFSGFGRSESNILNIYLVSEEPETSDTDIGDSATVLNPSMINESKSLIWSMQARSLDTRRNLWYYGQVPIERDVPYQVR